MRSFVSQSGEVYALIRAKDLDIDEDFIEAQAFAYLGIRRIKKLPITYPQTTGVAKAIIGGKVI